MIRKGLKHVFMKTTSIFLILFLGNSCSNEQSIAELETTRVVPTNFVWSINILGEGVNTPYGDGSGKITCQVTAENAVRYRFKIGANPELEKSNGLLEYTVELDGINDYVIKISAYSSSVEVTRIAKTITVAIFEDQEQEQLEDSGLVWSDEFDNDGPIVENEWFSEIVPPVNGGWFNAEEQHYTNRIDNAYVSDGVLKIAAKKELYTAFNSTKNYTLARLNSKFSFTYGRVEVRAKPPKGGGTWPAIWTLGSNLNTVGWLFCGKIDIMEHAGNTIGRISAAIHTPSSNGNTINVGYVDIPDTTTEFHIYKADWTAKKIDFYVDDVLYYTYNPVLKNSATWPFDNDQFILLNIAMGGTLGGSIASDFSEAIMEIDYVRV